MSILDFSDVRGQVLSPLFRLYVIASALGEQSPVMRGLLRATPHLCVGASVALAMTCDDNFRDQNCRTVEFCGIISYSIYSLPS